MSEENNTSVRELSDVAQHPEENIVTPGGGVLNIKRLFSNTMYFYIREIIIVTAIFITTYAALQNSTPLISPVPQSGPIFPLGSLVSDWAGGELGPAMKRVGMSEASLLIYYAPWDASCLHSVAVVEKAAVIMQKQVNFIAINCWQPDSECRYKYATSKVNSWPVIMLLLAPGPSLHYRGPMESSTLVRFIQTGLKPLHRISEPEDLLELMIKYDAVFVGYVDFSLVNSGYTTLYHSALRWLEREPFNEVAFAVVTGKTAFTLGIQSVPSFRLFLWNETLEFPMGQAPNPQNIINWISSSLHQVALWMTLPVTKANTLEPYIEQGPALIMFTPRNEYRSNIDAYDMLKQIGLQYYNCHNDPWVQELVGYTEVQRIVNKESYYELRNICKKLKATKTEYIPKRTKMKETIPVSVTFNNWVNNSKDQNKFWNICPNSDSLKTDYINCNIYKHEAVVEECDIRENKDRRQRLTKVKPKEEIKSEPYIDHRSPKSLMDTDLKRKCNILDIADNLHKPLFIPLGDENYNEVPNITGLACKTNRSLSLLAMDSDAFHFVSERLGVNLLNKTDKTAIFIVDEEKENHFVMNEPITVNSVKYLIYNHTKNILERNFRDSQLSTKYTHSYKVFKTKRDNLESQNSRGNNFSANDKILNEISILEISSKIFENIVLKTNKTVIVFYYSPYCSFCQSAWHAYLTVAQLLEAVDDVKFVRIDTDNNDLPWYLTMDDLPTATIFPEQKSESRTFPNNIKFDVPNFLSFVLSSVYGETRLLGLLEICKSSKNEDNINSCWLELQRETLNMIGITLKKWRRHFGIQRTVLLRKLQLLKLLSINIAEYPKNTNNFEAIKDIIKNSKNISRPVAKKIIAANNKITR